MYMTMFNIMKIVLGLFFYLIQDIKLVLIIIFLDLIRLG